MKLVDILIPIIIVSVAAFATLQLSEAHADATPDIPAAPTVDGYPTLASIPLPDNQRIFLTEAPGQCPHGTYYGMLADINSGSQPMWFCWRLDTQRGVIRSESDDYAISVEDFNWTGPGREFLKRQVNL